VLAFDAESPDPSVPDAVRREIRAGLEEMRDTLLRDADSIRAQRAANGLENR
jgi:hypothetical protein